jgi:hypothetical protein
VLTGLNGMSDNVIQPKIFANKIIFQLIQHMVSDDMTVEPRDYMALRRVFKRCGGSWEKLAEGDQIQIELLKTVVTGWGQLPKNTKKSESLV